jgi:hypothetical protein
VSQAPTSRCGCGAAVDNRSMGWFERRHESELRRIAARTLYNFEVECRRQGWGDPAFLYDEEKDLFRWTDGKFAFSREHAD